METRHNGLSCSLAANVATLTNTAGRTDPHPSHIIIAGGGIVVNLAANAAEFFLNASTGARYTVIIRRET